MSIKQDLRQVIKPYYILNLIMSFSFVTLRMCQPFCYYIFPDAQCELEMRESEILFFLLIIVMMRARKSGSMTMLSYITNSFIYCKIANTLLWYFTDVRFGLLYTIIFIVQGLLLPEPTSGGPDQVIYFSEKSFESEVDKDFKTTWLVAFYTAWSPNCVNFAPLFAQLSNEYTLTNLRFGKVDVGRYPELAKRFYVNDSSFSRQLPTVILFKNGKEVDRRPAVMSNRKLEKFTFNPETTKAAFDMNNLFTECKAKLKEPKPKVEKDGHAKTE